MSFRRGCIIMLWRKSVIKFHKHHKPTRHGYGGTIPNHLAWDVPCTGGQLGWFQWLKRDTSDDGKREKEREKIEGEGRRERSGRPLEVANAIGALPTSGEEKREGGRGLGGWQSLPKGN